MPSKQQSIVLGGVLIGILSTSYLGLINMLCCAGVIIGALVAVWHYTSQNELTISGGQGAAMGVMAALLGWAIAFVLNFVLIKAGIRSDQAISQFILDKVGSNMPPEQYDQMLQQMEQEVTFGKYFLNSLIGLGLSAVFGAIGGAIGAAVFKKAPPEDLLSEI
jgi:uncharacterized protein YybS (DUF2232 family)